MKFYTKPHHYTCGIDLHARSLYVCILDEAGSPVIHKPIQASPAALLQLIAPYQSDLIIGVECMFSALAPASPYRLPPCRRPGTGWSIFAPIMTSTLCSAMPCT